jgi:hypothetical protein
LGITGGSGTLTGLSFLQAVKAAMSNMTIKYLQADFIYLKISVLGCGFAVRFSHSV